MRLKLITTPGVEKDLTVQYHWYLHRAGEELAERFIADFKLMISQLEKQPYLGRLRKFRPPPLRGMRSIAVRRTFHSHLIFYRIEPGALVVFRMMHGARDLENRLVE